MKRILFISVILLMLLPVTIMGQSATTGAITGVVVNNDGTPLAGVFVKAVHIPTGTVFTSITRADGKYLIPAVRAGGPYKVSAAMSGFATRTKKGIKVSLGEKEHVNFALELATVNAGEVVVTATESIINKSRTGASQNVDQLAIEELPTISRSLSDFTRLAPQFASGEDSGAFSAAGRNSKYNNIQVDGAQNNDLFGLDASGTPGGQANTTPISLDAVQEFQIVLAPYDVRYGGFTGGGINVITKSGTNQYHGSAFYYGRDENLVGNGPSDYEFAKFSESIFGATIGGAIIKNKLFFFLSAEKSNKKAPQDYFIDGSGSDNDFGHKDEADRILSVLNGYGYDAGGYDQIANETKSDKLFFRLDWNINDKHRLTLRHNYVNASRESLYRSSSRSFNFGNAGVLYLNKTNSTVLQLNSNFSEKLFNELILNYSTIRDNPTFMGKAFPRISVRTNTGVTFYAGSEEYRHRNQLDQDLFELTDNMTIFSGKHTFIIGTHNEFFKFYNVFIQREFGKYEFGSIDDLEAGKPYKFDRYYSATNDPNAPARFNVSQIGLYAGDEFAMKDNFTLTYGLRMDVPLMSDTPVANPAVEASFGIPTDQNAGGNPLWSPRVGFNWDVKNDNEMQVRGGIGIFSGRAPYVWISNQFSNTGMEIARYKTYHPDFFITDPYNQPDNPYARTSGDINLIDKNFKFPQVLRTNIAVDKKLPWGFTGTVEFIYTKNINEVKFQNINIAETGVKAFDGRSLYGSPSTSGRHKYGHPNLIDKSFWNVIKLSNTNQGYEYSLSFQLQKQWSGNMINASYTYGEAKSLFSGTSSRAISNWKYNITAGNPNNPKLAYSAHDTRHRFVLALTKKFNFIKKAATAFSLFYNGRSGRPYSTRFYNDFNGDGVTNDSIWVPEKESDVILNHGTWAELDQYIKDDPALDSNRGKILPRNASRDPWSHIVDFKISQDVPMPFKGHRLQLVFTIQNFLNMFNKDWGVIRYVQYDEAPLTWCGIDSTTGKPILEFWGKTDTADARYTINQLLSRWKAQFGIRYFF